MSETSTKGAEEASPTPAVESGGAAAFGSPDWEKRLEEARKKREQALADRAKSGPAPKKKAKIKQVDMSQGLGPDALSPVAANAPVSSDVSQPEQDAKPDPVAVMVAKAQAMPAPAPHAPPASATAQSETAKPSPEPRFTAKQGAMILVACCFGIGFGLAVGIGVMFGMGWISAPTGTAPVQAAAPQGTASPDVVVSVSGLPVQVSPVPAVPRDPPLPVADDAPRIARAAVSPLAPLPRPMRADPAILAGPAQGVVASVPVISLTSSLLMRPSDAAVPFRDATPVAFLGAPLWQTARPSTQSPANAQPLEAAPGVDVLSRLAALAQGDLSGDVFEMPITADIGPSQRAQVAALIHPEAAPVFDVAKIPSDTPPKVAAAFTTGGMTPPNGVVPVAFSATPDTGLRARTAPTPVAFVPTLDQTLPFVGPPPVRALTLADKLGLPRGEADAHKLYLHAPESVSDDALSERLSELDTTGFPLAKVERVKFKITAMHVRYYDPSDAAVAKALAQDMGVKARDFTRNGGHSGRIEIWMAGESNTRVAPKPRRRTAAPTRRVDPRLQLRNSLIQKLRRGDHL